MAFAIKHSTDVDDIIDISWRQSRSKTEVLIFEIGKMDDLIPIDTAEQIREAIKLNNVKVRQISNYKKIDKNYSGVEDFISQMDHHYIDPAVFKVSSEIVIFENTVGIYRVKPSVSYLEINDANYAEMMRELFNNIWGVSEVMVLGFGGSESAKQYKPISTKLKVGKKQAPAIIYPAKDDSCIEKAFDRNTPGSIESYLQECAIKFKDQFEGADLILAYAWNDGKERVMDCWFLTKNRISDDSGFLYDAITIKEAEVVKDMGVSSGNSSIVITAEELLLRDLILEQGLSFEQASDREKYFPKFPPGMKPSEEFYLKS